MPNPLFATKSVDKLRSDAESNQGLRRHLGALDLTLLGIGGIIGTGIFVLTGQAAAVNSGPAVALSFVVAGIAAAFGALCYSEMASMIPVSGSAYTYSYATMGELVAWIIGWDLILEYLVGAATVSVGWSGYVVAFIESLGIHLPHQWVNAPVTWNHATSHFEMTGAILNVPAILIALFTATVLAIGIKESARFNAISVAIKVTVVLAFIAFTAKYIRTENWHPFIPPNTSGKFGDFGLSGIFQGATMVFFAYVGFDAVSTAAQETKNPQRDLPIGMIVSLAVCTVLYVVVSLMLTGVVSYKELSVPNPISVGVAATGLHWLATAVEVGAIAGLTSVLLVMQLGQSRVFFSMAKDGLLPPIIGKVSPRFGTPFFITLVVGGIVAVTGGILPVAILGELTSIGTLFAFVLVSLGVMILRRTRPDLPRAFRVPGGDYLVPLCGAATSAALMYTATTATVVRLFVWMAIGLVIYLAYGRKHSLLRRENAEQNTEKASASSPGAVSI